MVAEDGCFGMFDVEMEKPLSLNASAELSEDIPCGSKKLEIELSTLFKFKKAQAVKKAQFTKCSNQFRSMLNEFEIPEFGVFQEARKKLNLAHDEAVEVILQLSGGLHSIGGGDQAMKVIDEVDTITEVLDQTEVLVASFILRNEEDWRSSSKNSFSRVGSWVNQQQARIKSELHRKDEEQTRFNKLVGTSQSNSQLNKRRTATSSDNMGVD